MELSELKNRIIESFEGAPEDLQQVLQIVEEDRSVYPFNEYEHLIHCLMDKGGLTFANYMEIRTEYVDKNPNLWIFEISAPRGFGEKFAQTYISGMCSELEKPSRSLDPDYSGEYDFWLNGIKIEVKASRAVDADSDEPLYVKALSSETDKRFLMNFQQLKPSCCDVFIWVAVFRDKILLWVLSSQDVLDHRLYSSGQHRGNHGNEGQLHVKEDNIDQLAPFLLGAKELKKAIIDAAARS